MGRVNDGMKPPAMTPVVTGQEDRGLKPLPMMPAKPIQPAQAQASPAEMPKK
jgi:hypothetical protein